MEAVRFSGQVARKRIPPAEDAPKGASEAGTLRDSSTEGVMPVVVRGRYARCACAGSRLRTDFRSGNYERGESYTGAEPQVELSQSRGKCHRAGGNFSAEGLSNGSVLGCKFSTVESCDEDEGERLAVKRFFGPFRRRAERTFPGDFEQNTCWLQWMLTCSVFRKRS